MKLLVFIFFFSSLTTTCLGQKYIVNEIKTDLKGTLFCPTYWGESLIVCCDKKDRIFTTVKDKHGNEPVDLYLIHPEIPDSTSRFEDIFRTIYHDGPITFDKNQKFAAISRNLKSDQNFKHLQAEENHLGIYFSTFKNESWTELEAFAHNDSSYNCSHPSLNDEGNLLYFSSNMPGGFGGYDIWRSEKKGGIWKKPINMGAFVNSKNDEYFPSIDDEYLYFSANNAVYGGLDVYSYHFETNEMDILGEEINSKYDDFGLISSSQLDSGYFSSNRSGKDRIYKFRFEYPVFEPCDPLVETYFCYRLQDEYAMELESLDGLVYTWNVNGERKEGVTVDYCFPETGDYEITLDIEDTIIHQTFFEQSYIYISIAYEEQPYIACPDTVKPGEYFELDAFSTNLPNVTIANNQYYWLVGGVKQYRGKSIQHMFEKPGEYEIQLGIIGNDGENEVRDCAFRTIICGTETDSTIYPLDLLSYAKDSNIVDNNLTLITEKRIYSNPNDSTSYFTIELAKNQDSLLLESYNLKLLDGKYKYKLKYLPEEDVYIYITGHFETIEEAYKTWKELQILGLENSIVRSLEEDELEFILDDIFVLKNIQFESDKWDILPEAIPELKKVIEVMKVGKEFNVEIGAHTDNSASEEYNLNLSNKRANSIANYIIDAGVDADRIQKQGYGESNPIASNETKEGKQENRRVEFKILKK